MRAFAILSAVGHQLVVVRRVTYNLHATCEQCIMRTEGVAPSGGRGAGVGGRGGGGRAGFYRIYNSARLGLFQMLKSTYNFSFFWMKKILLRHHL